MSLDIRQNLNKSHTQTNIQYVCLSEIKQEQLDRFQTDFSLWTETRVCQIMNMMPDWKVEHNHIGTKSDFTFFVTKSNNYNGILNYQGLNGGILYTWYYSFYVFNCSNSN
jgi:hypothetical protein